MGDFIKELNVIDFLGILLPGAFLLLLFGSEFQIWELMGGYWGTNDPSAAIRITLLLVGGYIAGSLLHEAGDLLEKALWKYAMCDPRSYAARATGIYMNMNKFIKNEQGSSDTAKKKNFRVCILWTLIPVSAVWYAMFPVEVKVDMYAISIAVYLVIFLFLLPKFYWNDKRFPDLTLIEAVRGSDAIFLNYPLKENYKIRKRMLFDGFRAMSRNLFIALAVLKTYAQFSDSKISTLSTLLQTIQGNNLYAAALFLVQMLLLFRYFHFSYLKYKYCYEDYKNGGNANKRYGRRR